MTRNFDTLGIGGQSKVATEDRTFRHKLSTTVAFSFTDMPDDQLWERWQQGETVLETFTVITTVANELVAEIHAKKRMPVIIPPADYDRWLRSASEVRDLPKPFPSHLMEAMRVGKRVNPPDDGPSLFSRE